MLVCVVVRPGRMVWYGFSTVWYENGIDVLVVWYDDLMGWFGSSVE